MMTSSLHFEPVSSGAFSTYLHFRHTAAFCLLVQIHQVSVPQMAEQPQRLHRVQSALFIKKRARRGPRQAIPLHKRDRLLHYIQCVCSSGNEGEENEEQDDDDEEMPHGKQHEQAIWQELEASEGSIRRYLEEEEAMSFWMCICKQVCWLLLSHLVFILIAFPFRTLVSWWSGIACCRDSFNI